MITEKWKENKYRNKISNLKELLYVYNSISSNKDEVKLLKSLIKYAEITFNLYIIRKFKNNRNLNNTLLNLESFDIFENFDKYNDNDNIYEINQSLNHFPNLLNVKEKNISIIIWEIKKSNRIKVVPIYKNIKESNFSVNHRNKWIRN